LRDSEKSRKDDLKSADNVVTVAGVAEVEEGGVSEAGVVGTDLFYEHCNEHVVPSSL